MFRTAGLIVVIAAVAYWMLWHPSTSQVRGTPTVVDNPYVTANVTDDELPSSPWHPTWLTLLLGITALLGAIWIGDRFQRRQRREAFVFELPARDEVPPYNGDSSSTDPSLSQLDRQP